MSGCAARNRAIAGGWESPAKLRMLEVLREVGEEFAGRRGELRLAS